MTSFWQKLRRTPQASPEPPLEKPVEQDRQILAQVEEMELNPDDPLLTYLIANANAVEVGKLNLQSPTLDRLRASDVKVIVPLVSQGELIGLINLGPRRSEQDYSPDDRRLLNTLATQAAPALRVAQLARQQQIEARERERIEQELKVARVIQETLLPKEVPVIPGWNIKAFWQPAREVSGDFYDFLSLPDGRLCILIADVTDKGVPAALVMATTRSLLRAASERLIEPGKVLERTNDLLHPDIPTKMFVTCLCLVINPVTGEIILANAGHNLPYQRTASGISEHRATGMPLGLLSGMTYNEIKMTLGPGENLLLLSDGLIEGHNPNREMFGFARVKSVMAEGGEDLIGSLMQAFEQFVGSGTEQEDDITMVTLTRAALPGDDQPCGTETGQILAELEIPSQPGNERLASAQVLQAISGLQFSELRLRRLETAVAEATMNAMEHGNHYDPSKPVRIRIIRCENELAIQIRDEGGGAPIPSSTEPDLEAKLAGLQSPRGWGLFLIKNMVDEMHLISDATHHTIELIINLGE